MTEYACGELEVWRRLVQEVMGMQEKDKVTLKGNMGIKESCFFFNSEDGMHSKFKPY